MEHPVTEQDIAQFQEAFFTRPGDGTLTVEKLAKIFRVMELDVSEKDLQVSIDFRSLSLYTCISIFCLFYFFKK